jgi:hypothetical protein
MEEPDPPARPGRTMVVRTLFLLVKVAVLALALVALLLALRPELKRARLALSY